MTDEPTLAERLAAVGYEFLPDREPTEFLPPDERATVDEAVEALREMEPRITELERKIWSSDRRYR